MQVMWLSKFNFYAVNKGVEISFSNMWSYEFNPGVTVGIIFNMCLVTAGVFIVILLYLWPLAISPSQDRELGLLYPLTCACLGKAKPRVAPEGQDPNETTDTEQDDLEKRLLGVESNTESSSRESMGAVMAD